LWDHTNTVEVIWRLSSFTAGGRIQMATGTWVEPPTYRKLASSHENIHTPSRNLNLKRGGESDLRSSDADALNREYNEKRKMNFYNYAKLRHYVSCKLTDHETTVQSLTTSIRLTGRTVWCAFRNDFDTTNVL
jgi:hypothetical protein